MATRDEILNRLKPSLGELRTPAAAGILPSGIAGLDTLLPERGFRPGTLVEWLGSGGSGATLLALLAARQACARGGTLVVLDAQRRFYPPAAAALGLRLENMVVLAPRRTADANWAINQALRCSAVAAVLCWCEAIDDVAFRRLQLAAEAGGGLGLLVRPAEMLLRPSWAEVRLLVRGLPSEARRRFRIECVRGKAVSGRQAIDVEFDDETNRLRMVSPVAPAASAARAAGA